MPIAAATGWAEATMPRRPYASIPLASGRSPLSSRQAPSSIIVQFVSTYGVWMLAERAGLSPILTLVSYAMTLARSGPVYLPARLRIPSYAVWDTAVLVLNVLAFLVIGLELGPIIKAAGSGELGRSA